MATAIKNILDSKQSEYDEKKLAVLWEYYEYFNGIDKNEELNDKSQNKVEQSKEALKKITDSNDFKEHKKSSSTQSAIITGKLKLVRLIKILKQNISKFCKMILMT